VYINVLYTAKPPIAKDDRATTNMNTPVEIRVLDNDFDLDGTLLPATLIVLPNAQPINGIVTVDNVKGTVNYTPGKNFFGADQFTYQICDNNGNCASARVFVTVINSMRPPKAQNDYATVNNGGTVTVDVVANDVDPNNSLDIATVKIMKGPSSKAKASVDLLGRITFDYSEVPNFIGVDTLVYQVCNYDGLCDMAYVFVTVKTVAEFGLIIPNGYSPNGDGINDKFEIPGIENYPGNEMLIYNRWGSLVYRKVSYKGEWDGFSNITGDELPVGSYFYVLHLNNGKGDLKGYIYLNR
jgi:gliding motility-associated-like protein